jgi:hypothetical protein
MPCAEEFPRHASLDHSTLGQPKPVQIDLDQGVSAVPKYPALRAGADILLENCEPEGAKRCGGFFDF